MITAQIKPAKAYVNGHQMTATQFNVKSLNDNLYDEVTFLYTLLDEHGTWAGEATYTLKGRENYVTWDATASGAYQIVANGIGLELVPTIDGKLFDF